MRRQCYRPLLEVLENRLVPTSTVSLPPNAGFEYHNVDGGWVAVPPGGTGRIRTTDEFYAIHIDDRNRGAVANPRALALLGDLRPGLTIDPELVPAFNNIPDSIYFAFLETGTAEVYGTLSLTFTAEAGQTIKGSVFFYETESHSPNSPVNNDDGRLRILDGNGNEVITLFAASVQDVMESKTPEALTYTVIPWTAWEFTFTESGTYTIEASVRNRGDSEDLSALGLDIDFPAPVAPPPVDGPAPGFNLEILVPESAAPQQVITNAPTAAESSAAGQQTFPTLTDQEPIIQVPNDSEPGGGMEGPEAHLPTPLKVEAFPKPQEDAKSGDMAAAASETLPELPVVAESIAPSPALEHDRVPLVKVSASTPTVLAAETFLSWDDLIASALLPVLWTAGGMAMLREVSRGGTRGCRHIKESSLVSDIS